MTEKKSKRILVAHCGVAIGASLVGALKDREAALEGRKTAQVILEDEVGPCTIMNRVVDTSYLDDKQRDFPTLRESLRSRKAGWSSKTPGRR